MDSELEQKTDVSLGVSSSRESGSAPDSSSSPNKYFFHHFLEWWRKPHNLPDILKMYEVLFKRITDKKKKKKR